jgi:hypothetical protein
MCRHDIDGWRTAERSSAKSLVPKHEPSIDTSLDPAHRLNAALIKPKKLPPQHPDVAGDQAIARKMWQKPVAWNRCK